MHGSTVPVAHDRQGVLLDGWGYPLDAISRITTRGRSVVGTYHHMSVKHLSAYLDEMERFNNRENPYLFRDTLLVLLHGDALPYQVLIERDEPGQCQRENDALMRREARRQARRPCQ